MVSLTFRHLVIQWNHTVCYDIIYNNRPLYNDKPAYNDISFGHIQNTINLMYIKLVYNNEWIKMKPTCKEKFAFFETVAFYVLILLNKMLKNP